MTNTEIPFELANGTVTVFPNRKENVTIAVVPEAGITMPNESAELFHFLKRRIFQTIYGNLWLHCQGNT